MKQEAVLMAKLAYITESDCIREMLGYFEEEVYAKAVDLLKNAPRIGASGCGHSGIMCQHFAHLMCCIERPACYIYYETIIRKYCKTRFFLTSWWWSSIYNWCNIIWSR